MGLERYKKYFKKFSKNKIIVGLTGNIGSGKSSVLNIFKELGFFTISSDEIVKEILTKKEICDKIIKRYHSVKDKGSRIDKSKLAKLLFRNERAKNFVENLLHPLVIKEIIKRIKESEGSVVIVEVPLLFEKNLESFFDLIICVIAKDKIRMKRLIKRGMKKDDIKQREKNQFDQKFKIKHSDIIIDNSSSYEVLKEKVLGIYNLIKKLT